MKAIYLLPLFLLTGCGSGSSDSDSSLPPEQTPPPIVDVPDRELPIVCNGMTIEEHEYEVQRHYQLECNEINALRYAQLPFSAWVSDEYNSRHESIGEMVSYASGYIYATELGEYEQLDSYQISRSSTYKKYFEYDNCDDWGNCEIVDEWEQLSYEAINYHNYKTVPTEQNMQKCIDKYGKGTNSVVASGGVHYTSSFDEFEDESVYAYINISVDCMDVTNTSIGNLSYKNYQTQSHEEFLYLLNTEETAKVIFDELQPENFSYLLSEVNLGVLLDYNRHIQL